VNADVLIFCHTHEPTVRTVATTSKGPKGVYANTGSWAIDGQRTLSYIQIDLEAGTTHLFAKNVKDATGDFVLSGAGSPQSVYW